MWYEIGDRVRVRDNEGRDTLGTVVAYGEPITMDGAKSEGVHVHWEECRISDD